MNLELTLSDRPRWTENYFNNFYEENRIIKYSKDTIYIIDQNGLAKINLPNEIKKSYLKQGLTSAEFAMFKKGKRKTNNEQIYDLTNNRFINFSLPKEYKDFRILGKVKNKLWLINSGKQKIAQIEIE